MSFEKCETNTRVFWSWKDFPVNKYNGIPFDAHLASLLILIISATVVEGGTLVHKNHVTWSVPGCPPVKCTRVPPYVLGGTWYTCEVYQSVPRRSGRELVQSFRKWYCWTHLFAMFSTVNDIRYTKNDKGDFVLTFLLNCWTIEQWNKERYCTFSQRKHIYINEVIHTVWTNTVLLVCHPVMTYSIDNIVLLLVRIELHCTEFRMFS